MGQTAGMKMRNVIALLIILPCLASGALVPVSAADDDADTANQDWHDLHKEVKAGHLVPMTTIMDWLEARFEGQILEVELEQDHGHGSIEYEVEMIGPQGQVVEFEFDATTGELLSIEGVNIEAMKKTP